MADTYPNWAALSAVEVSGKDYRIEARRTTSLVSHIAVHGGGIEAGSSEVAGAVASATGGQYYALVGTKSSNNGSLHITSTRFDEPTAVDVQMNVKYTVSYHGLSGAAPVVHIGGADSGSKAQIGAALKSAGFEVDFTPVQEIGGDDPKNIANRNISKAGVQLEMTLGLRQSFFPNGDTSRAMRESGRRTATFRAFVDAIAGVVEGYDDLWNAGTRPGEDWGEADEAFATGGYRVLFCNLLTDAVVDVLPVAGLAFDTFIGKIGSLRGQIPVTDVSLAERVRQAAVPGSTAVWVERGGDVWWGGILWAAKPSSADNGAVSVEITCATFDSYFSHRVLHDTQVHAQKDQLSIARALFAYCSVDQGGDLGFVLTQQRSGVLRDRTYHAEDMKDILSLVNELSATEDGFEWRVSVHRDALTGKRVKQVDLGYPVINTGAFPVVLSMPGEVLSYTMPDDGTEMANTWRARGGQKGENASGQGVAVLSPIYVNVSALDAGWARLDRVSDHNNITTQSVLNAQARSGLRAATQRATTTTVHVRLAANISPELVGSRIRLRILDVWHPQGSVAEYRVIGMSVTPASRGESGSAELHLEETHG